MAFDKIRSHTFRDRLYHIFWRRYRRSADEIKGQNFGRCEHPTTPRPRMHIYPSKDDLDLLMTVIHESLHACMPDLDNDAVDEYDADLAKLLRRMKIKVSFEAR